VDAPAGTRPDTGDDGKEASGEDRCVAAAPFMTDRDTGSGGITAHSYWFNSYRFDRVAAIHASLEAFKTTGKVLSLETTAYLLQQLNQQKPLDNFFLSILYKQLPDALREQLFEPYLSPDGDQLRFAVRVFETGGGLDRDEQLVGIRRQLVQNLEIAPAQLHLTGMLVLYNNMLHSLFCS